MKKIFAIIAIFSLLSTSALASDYKKAEKIFDQLTDLMSKANEFIAAYKKHDMTTCYKLEGRYAHELKKIMESTMGLSTDYSYLFTSADALQSCLSCNDIKANCEYAMENMQKASDQLKQHKDN